MKEVKHHIVRAKQTGFTAWSKGSEVEVPVDEIIALQQGHHYEVIFTVRGAEKDFFNVKIPAIIGKLYRVILTRKSLDFTGVVHLDVILIEYDCSLEELENEKRKMKDEYEAGLNLFGAESKNNNKSLSELGKEIQDLFNNKKRR